MAVLSTEDEVRPEKMVVEVYLGLGKEAEMEESVERAIEVEMKVALWVEGMGRASRIEW